MAAGRALAVNQSTVQRRLAGSNGASVARSSTAADGLPPDRARRGDGAHAEAVERAVLAFERHLHTLAAETVGVVRMTCPEPLVNRITQTSLLDRFHARHPTLRVQFVMSDKYIDLGQGEADIALRSGDTDDDELVGRKIGDSIWAVYASRTYVERHGQPASVEDLDSTCPGRLRRHDGQASRRPMAAHRWRRTRRSSPAATACSACSTRSRRASASGPCPASGRRRGRPCACARTGSRARPDLAAAPTPELRRTPRVAALFDFLVEEIDTLKPILTG